MAVTENDIINNASAIASLINSASPGKEISDFTKLVSPAATDPVHIQNGGVDKYMEAQDAGLYPKEVAVSGSGSTVINFANYGRNVNIKITLVANATLIFSNIVAGQTGAITIVQDGSTKYTFSFPGTSYGDTIEEPEIGEINVVSFIIASINAGSAAPIFGIKTNV